jgi:hypothetical protein
MPKFEHLEEIEIDECDSDGDCEDQAELHDEFKALVDKPPSLKKLTVGNMYILDHIDEKFKKGLELSHTYGYHYYCKQRHTKDAECECEEERAGFEYFTDVCDCIRRRVCVERGEKHYGKHYGKIPGA